MYLENINKFYNKELVNSSMVITNNFFTGRREALDLQIREGVGRTLHEKIVIILFSKIL